VISNPAPTLPQVNSAALAAFLPIPDDAVGLTPVSDEKAPLWIVDALLSCIGEVITSPTAPLSSLESRALQDSLNSVLLSGLATQHRSASDSAAFTRLHDPTTHQCARDAVAEQTGYDVSVTALTPAVLHTDADLLIELNALADPEATSFRLWFGSFGEFRAAVVFSGRISALESSEAEFSSAIQRLSARVAR
jgi:hypothetical protein